MNITLYTCTDKSNYFYTCTSTFCQFLENGKRYKAEIFSVHLYFDKLSNDISHVVVA